MANKSHSAELWFFIRLIYENCLENITLKEILAKAQEYYPDCDMPTFQSLSRRINEENWQKKSNGRLFGLNNQSLIKILLNHREVSKDYQELNNDEQYAVMTVERKTKIDRLFNERKFHQRKLAGVLLEHRRNNHKASLYYNYKLEQLMEIEHKLLNFSEYYYANPDEFKDIDFETAFAVQIKNFKLICDGMNIAETMSRAVTNLMKNDFILYGINPDDTREPDTAKRLASLDEDKEFYEEQERMALENQKRIAERMALLQSGVYEEQVKQQALANARQYEMNSDIEDGDFDEIL